MLIQWCNLYEIRDDTLMKPRWTNNKKHAKENVINPDETYIKSKMKHKWIVEWNNNENMQKGMHEK